MSTGALPPFKSSSIDIEGIAEPSLKTRSWFCPRGLVATAVVILGASSFVGEELGGEDKSEGVGIPVARKLRETGKIEKVLDQLSGVGQNVVCCRSKPNLVQEPCEIAEKWSRH